MGRLSRVWRVESTEYDRRAVDERRLNDSASNTTTCGCKLQTSSRYRRCREQVLVATAGLVSMEYDSSFALAMNRKKGREQDQI